MSASLQALLIDDDQNNADAFKPIWERILRKVWEPVTINIQTSFDDETYILEHRPHIVIFDNVSIENGREVENKGVQRISELKKAYPDILFILFTSRTFSIDSLGYRLPNPDIIATKTPLPNDKYEEELAAQISRLVTRLPISQISFDKVSDLEEISCTSQEARSLIEQCVRNFQILRREDLRDFSTVNQITLSKLSGGYSGSAVFKCSLSGFLGGRNSEFVIKIGSKEATRIESQNYIRFVRLQIPHHIRVDLVGIGETANTGASMYGFAFGSSRITSSLTEHIEKSDTEVLRRFRDTILSKEAVGWYNFSGDTVVVEDYFNSGEEYDPVKDGRRLASIKEACSLHLPSDFYHFSDEFFELDGLQTLQPRKIMQELRGQELPRFICHGDLNSNNIITFSDGGYFSLIDFEYAGLDLAYKDFVSLEVSIRAHLPVDANEDLFEEFFECEQFLYDAFLSNDFELPTSLSARWEEYFSEVFAHRKQMCEILRSSKVEVKRDHYYLLLIFHLFKVAAVPAFSKNEFTRLFFSYFSSCFLVERDSDA